MNLSTRMASCSCSLVVVTCVGEPVRVSVCHCLACQRRTGSAFGAQVRFVSGQVEVSGNTRTYVRTADSGKKVRSRFCMNCGSTVAYELDADPGVTAVPLGAFADPAFSPFPIRSIYESRRHPWVVVLGDEVEHED